MCKRADSGTGPKQLFRMKLPDLPQVVKKPPRASPGGFFLLKRIVTKTRIIRLICKIRDSADLIEAAVAVQRGRQPDAVFRLVVFQQRRHDAR